MLRCDNGKSWWGPARCTCGHGIGHAKDEGYCIESGTLVRKEKGQRGMRRVQRGHEMAEDGLRMVTIFHVECSAESRGD
jgi:hypothetical protein